MVQPASTLALTGTPSFMHPPHLTNNLEPLLTDARQLGFLGPGPVHDQIARSLAFATMAGTAPDELAIDLGSGGGLPGLVLAIVWPDSEWLLIDSNVRRAAWLQAAVEGLGIASRVRALCERAELTARGQWRQTAGLVTARGFGPPAPTAECAAGLLRVGGRLLVADPPGQLGERWPQDGLASLGLQLETSKAVDTEAGPVSLSQLRSASDCGPRYPRRVGVPFKRPLF
jgi:16S rRNA (guanine527-N7)-methyltransferase